MKFKLSILTAILILSSSIFGQFGHDQSFSDDGFLRDNPITGSFEEAPPSAIERLSDGKYLVVGSAQGLTENRLVMTVQKLNVDGTIDTTFGGGDGVFTLLLNDLGSEGRGMAIQPDGKIVVAGFSTIEVPGTTGVNRETLVRLNPDGSIDATFASNGVYVQPHPISNLKDLGTEAFDIKFLPNGNIVTAGQHIPRFNSIPDPCHNNEGLAPPCSTIAIYSSNGTNLFRDYIDLGIHQDSEFISDIEIQPDGKIVGVISNFPNPINDFAVVRFNSNGTVDTTFGVNGVARTSDFFGNIHLFARNVELQSDGKILLTGSTTGFISARFNSNGTLDNTYGIGGKTQSILTASSARLSGEATVIMPNGKILSCGANDRFIRLNPNGTRDTSFGDDGVLHIVPPLSVGYMTDMILQDDGKLVYASRSSTLSSGQWIVGRMRPTNGEFDFDGDSRTDVSIFRPSVGQWWTLSSSDGGNSVATFGTSTDKLVPADYTGDGITDIAFWRPNTGEWFVLRSEDNSFYSFPFGTNGDIPVPGDYDADGIDDTAVYRPSAGTWFILNSSGGTTITGFGISEDKPVVDDYDGDGKDDIAIFRPSNSQWWINRSQDGVIVYQFGANGDKPVQGDHTGDGKADVAFWRPSSGEWFVVRSEDNSFYSFPFGQASDFPSPGDYDGDGTFDAAVFRPSNNVWYINGSSSGTQIIGFGASGDIPVPNAFVP